MGRARYPKPSKPRSRADGIQARSRRGQFAEHWWADRWISSLERITDAGRLRRGRSYARGGQVLSIEESKGEIQARVQGSRATPYRVTIRLQPLSDAQWQAVWATLAERAIFTAQLLAGEMPQTIEEVFRAAGVSLLPNAASELETDCSCPDWANPCKHVAAVHYILGEQFDEDPFLIFRLRGRSQEQVMAALRLQRQAEPPTHAAAPALLAEESASYRVADVAPLEETLATFWEMGKTPENFSTAIQAPAHPYPILRRLGPAAFAPDVEAVLGPAYAAMTRAALELAFVGEAGPKLDDEADNAGA